MLFGAVLIIQWIWYGNLIRCRSSLALRFNVLETVSKSFEVTHKHKGNRWPLVFCWEKGELTSSPKVPFKHQLLNCWISILFLNYCLWRIFLWSILISYIFVYILILAQFISHSAPANMLCVFVMFMQICRTLSSFNKFAQMWLLSSLLKSISCLVNKYLNTAIFL